MKWSKQLEKGKSWRKDEDGWRDELHYFQFYSLSALYDPFRSKGLIRTFQTHRQWHRCTLIAAAAQKHHTVEKAAGAATRTWSNSNELLWCTSQSCFSKLVWRLFMSTLFHIVISKTEIGRDHDNMTGWGSVAATPIRTFHTHMISKAMQLNN